MFPLEMTTLSPGAAAHATPSLSRRLSPRAARAAAAAGGRTAVAAAASAAREGGGVGRLGQRLNPSMTLMVVLIVIFHGF